MAIFRRRTPITGTSNAGGVGKNHDSRRISGYRSMTAAVRTTATVHRAVYRNDRHASVNLVYHSLQHGRPRRKEQNLIVGLRSSKSEAEVTS